MTVDSVTVHDDVMHEFRNLKVRKNNYVLCRFADDYASIVVDKSGKLADYDEFVQVLPENEPRYALYDYEYTTADGRKTSKIVLFSWLPDASPLRPRMVFAAAKSTLRNALEGIAVEIQATDHGDLDTDEVNTRINR